MSKKQINLLTDAEIKDIYARPKFDDVERDYFFQLSDEEHNLLIKYTSIRMDQKDFSYTALKLEVKKSEKIKELYRLCKTLVPSLQISNNAVRYYGSLAEQYTPSATKTER